MTTYFYGILTDDTDTFTFGDNTATNSTADAGVESFLPGIASPRTNALGGYGEYEEVVMSIDCEILASSAANVYAAYEKLKRLLDKAEAWYKSNGTQGAAVLFKWSPAGGTTSTTSDPLQAAILGRAIGDNTASLTMPSEFPKSGNRYSLKGVQLRIVRSGQWLLTTQTATHNSVTNGDLATLTFASGQNVTCPTKIDLTNVLASTNDFSIKGGFVVVSEVANGINIINAETLANANFTSVSDSGNYAKNTNVLRYTPPNTSENDSTFVSVTIPSFSGNFALFINAKTSNSASNFLVRGRLFSSLTESYTGYVPISSTTRDWYSIGRLSLSTSGASVSFKIYVTASSTSYTLDIDTVVLVCLDTGNPRIIRLSDNSARLSALGTLSLDHRALTKPAPVVNFNYSSADYVHSYSDDPYISTSATTIYATLLGGGTSYWRQVDGGAVTTNNWTATRTIAHITPV